MLDLKDQKILLGISAGIAAYKTPILVRALRAAGAQVQVIMSANAHRFVTATSLQAVSGNPVRENLWDSEAEAAMGHIELARWADRLLIAPATANLMAKLAHGMADELLTTVCLATTAPVFLAPAMNQQMYQHPATQSNMNRLTDLGYQLLGPASGEQACGEEGLGRMLEPDELVQALTPAAARELPLKGRRVMITAGPTVEAIDPVRYISNHSSGLQGISLAEAARSAGATVTLIAGPNVAACDQSIHRVDVTSALDMQAAVTSHIRGIDLFIGVAAVADYRASQPASTKIKRSGEANPNFNIELVENPDIIAGVAKSAHRPIVVIGFAAETNNTHEHARAKLNQKGLDAIVLNDVSDPRIGFNSPTNAVTFIHGNGEIVLPLQTKQQVANNLISKITQIFARQLASTNPDSMPE